MRTLAFYDRKDYDLAYSRTISNSSRAIIIAGNTTALLYSEKYKIYLFPGGHIEKGETAIDALIRETREETGLVVKPKSIKEFGLVTEIRKDLWENKIFVKNDFYYTCEAEDITVEQNLTQGEKDAGYRFGYVSFEKAICANELAVQTGLKWIDIETRIMRLILKSLKATSIT